ncbi:hypothetical protein RDWZM_006310 [Blomia tropicalis]|uniref:BTB domain-containing protein n=1 Tax=Blomia tropicalis TaxID=40697 RepID=A0A9Q0M8B0_BLOTA|nr:BTB/POZ domain-containing protein kctd15 [Blomia tropicalis]KAJ6220498.1 hypothetical protein RDWZM_006310 [Blomia tropicalis]
MSVLSSNSITPGGGLESSHTYLSTSSNSSPARTSPTNSIHSNLVNLNHKISGIPCVAAASRYTAPVHIDVGGSIYTSSLETLTKHPDSRLARMFNGSIPIVLDSLKQHYFIDRDGKMFRHILNFLRTNTLAIPDNFDEIELLCEEAKYYDIQPLLRLLEQARQERNNSSNSNNLSRSESPNESNGIVRNNCVQNLSTKRIRLTDDYPMGDDSKISIESKLGLNLNQCRLTSLNNLSRNSFKSGRLSSDSATASPKDEGNENDSYSFQCLAINISPELGERVCISGERVLIEEIFPEISQTIMDSSKAAAWNQDAKHVIRFPLNGYCKLNSLQTIVRLLNNGFRMMASNGGGIEGQQFSEYLMVRKCSI